MASDDESPIEFSLPGIEDVQDFHLGDQGDTVDAGRSSHLYDLMKKGNKAFRDDRYEEAVNYYLRAHNIKPDDPVILSNRCVAYLRIGQFLRQRPASASERRPLSGLDPTTHASLALKDAEQFMNIQNNSAMAYILKANALILLEKFELARDVIRTGLQIDASSDALMKLERFTSNMFGKRSHGQTPRTDDFDCTVCLKLLYEVSLNVNKLPRLPRGRLFRYLVGAPWNCCIDTVLHSPDGSTRLSDVNCERATGVISLEFLKDFEFAARSLRFLYDRSPVYGPKRNIFEFSDQR